MPEVAHSRWGGSSATRYINCPGSVALIAASPPKPSSRYADEGTLAASFSEYWLKNGERQTAEYVDMTLDGAVDAPKLTLEMAAACQIYLDAVWEEFDRTPDAELYVETPFVLEVDSVANGEVYGRLDAMVYHPKLGRVVVFDLKYGSGVYVSEVDNVQLRFYAAGACFSHPDWPVAEVEIVIVQPRIHDAEPVRRHSVNPIDLMDFQQDIDDAIKKALEPDAPLQLGPWCRWCPAAALCPAKQQEVLAAAQLDYAHITDVRPEDLPPPQSYELERLGEVLKAAEILSAWQNQILEHVNALVMGGHRVPGWKAVQKAGRSHWSSPSEDIVADATEFYGLNVDEIFPRKLVTLTDFEKTMKIHRVSKDAIAAFKKDHTSKESTGLTLARDSDPRPAVDVAARDFGSLIEGGIED